MIEIENINRFETPNKLVVVPLFKIDQLCEIPFKENRSKKVTKIIVVIFFIFLFLIVSNNLMELIKIKCIVFHLSLVKVKNKL